MSNTAVKNKKPFGFYVCSLAFTFERMAYYSAKYLIFFFVAATILEGGLGLTKIEAAALQANLVAFTYLAPIVGGYISDNYIGARYCVPVGLLLMAGGYFFGSTATSAAGINIMIVLVSIGTGLFKGNVSAISGYLFDNEEQLDSAFSLQYSFVNVGSFIGTTVIGLLVGITFAHGDVQGFRPAFQLCAAFCVIDAIWFLFGMKHLGDIGKRPFKAGKHVDEVKPVVEKKPLTTSDKKRVFAIILISLFSVVFWVFWYLTYLAVYDYAENFVKLSFGGFKVPLSWFDSLNALVCIIMGPVLGALWFKLAKRPQGDLSLFKKLALGLSFLAFAFLTLVGAEISRGVGADPSAKASILWIIAFGILLTIGEMLFSPLGNSFVTKYAPAKMFAFLMGVWTFASFLAGKSYAWIYAITSKMPIMKAYTVIPVILFVCAVLLFVFDKKLMKLLEEDDKKKVKQTA